MTLSCRACRLANLDSITALQNKNYQSVMHCDKRNLGPSTIVGLGDYTDGKLWGAHPLTHSRILPPLPPLRVLCLSSPSLPSLCPVGPFSSLHAALHTSVLCLDGCAGQAFGAVDLKGGKWVDFDGNLPHCTLPFTGTRYTLIVSAATAGRLGLWLAATLAATTLTESVGANSTSSTRATATSAPAASTTSRRFAHHIPRARPWL